MGLKSAGAEYTKEYTYKDEDGIWVVERLASKHSASTLTPQLVRRRLGETRRQAISEKDLEEIKSLGIPKPEPWDGYEPPGAYGKPRTI